jgi:putative transcriptional regulator
MKPRHHPDQTQLITYASGELQEPLALIVATHLALCPDCRGDVARFETLGGMLLEDLPPAGLNRTGIDLSRAAAEDAPPCAGNAVVPESEGAMLPEPLRSYVRADAGRVKRRKGGLLSERRLLTDYPGFRTVLIRIRAGAAMPRHTHEGHEHTLVLSGGFVDQSGHYTRGDVAFADATVDHRPVADSGGDCLCLAVMDAPLRLTGFPGQLFNFMLRSW